MHDQDLILAKIIVDGHCQEALQWARARHLLRQVERHQPGAVYRLAGNPSFWLGRLLVTLGQQLIGYSQSRAAATNRTVSEPMIKPRSTIVL